MPDEDKIPPPLCVFCSAPWTDDMLKVYTQADFDWGYYPGEFHVEGYDTAIDVTCSSCKRLVYRKEIRQVPPEYFSDDGIYPAPKPDN